MQVKDLDNHYHSWNLTGHISHSVGKAKSSHHIRAKKLITEIYPTLQLLEEVSIPLRKSETLFLDFYLPLKKTCYEVHGEQHYKFVQFYHQTMFNFLKAQTRDREKQEWCYINDIAYVELPFDETEDQWRERIVR